MLGRWYSAWEKGLLGTEEKKNIFQLRIQGWNLVLNFKQLQTRDFLNLSYMLTGSFKNMYKWSRCSLILLLRFQFLHEVVNFFRSCHKIYPDTSLLNCSLINAGHCRARMTNFFQRMRYFTITGCWVWSVQVQPSVLKSPPQVGCVLARLCILCMTGSSLPHISLDCTRILGEQEHSEPPGNFPSRLPGL